MGTELFTVTVEDRLTPFIKERLKIFTPKNIANVVGRAVSEKVRSHLFAYDRTHPNQLGGKRTHLFGKAAESVSFVSDERGATVGASQLGLRQRLLGGPISPKNGKHLTFPVIAEAYGKSPREFPNLFVMFGKAHKPIGLGEKGAKGQPMTMFFVMTKKTINQQGDRTILPSPEEIANTAVAAIETLAKA